MHGCWMRIWQNKTPYSESGSTIIADILPWRPNGMKRNDNWKHYTDCCDIDNIIIIITIQLNIYVTLSLTNLQLLKLDNTWGWILYGRYGWENSAIETKNCY